MKTNEGETIELKLFLVLFAVLKDHEFHARGGCIFAQNRECLIEMIRDKYGISTAIRHIEEIPIEEGMILYGTEWHKLGGEI